MFLWHVHGYQNCLMWKRIASKAVKGLIGKLIWQTEKNTVWLLNVFSLSFPVGCSLLMILILVDCVVMFFLLATPSSLLPSALLWYISWLVSYTPSTLMTSLWLRLGGGMPAAWEYLLFFLCLIPQHWHLREAAGLPSIVVPSCLQMCQANEAWKHEKELETKELSCHQQI